MKKFAICLLSIMMIVSVLSGCKDSTANDSTINPTAQANQVASEIVYHADWPYYETVTDLVESADEVFTGKVVDIFFAVIDMQTGEVVESASEDGNTALYTVYQIDLTENYKGNGGETKYIAVIGGISDYDEEEQLAIIENSGLLEECDTIPLLDGSVPLDTGATYLFVANDYGHEYLRIPNPTQFAFLIDDAEATDNETIPSYTNIINYLSSDTIS